MDRVVITNAIIGICHMQVCAVKGATDEEILDVCNFGNPSGTTGGWIEVLRKDEEGGLGPLECTDDPNREHFLVAC